MSSVSGGGTMSSVPPNNSTPHNEGSVFDELSEGPAHNLFTVLKFYGVGVSQPVSRALTFNGAEECRFMSDDVTHIIIGTHMHKDQYVSNLSELYSQSEVVDESWAISSIMLHKILNPALFSPKSMSFFEGLIVSFSGLSPEDRRKLWFVMSHFGALCLIVLDSRCNLLISGSQHSLKYKKAMKMPDKISVVGPDWVIACLTNGKLEPMEFYHPKNVLELDMNDEWTCKDEPELTIGLPNPLKDPSILDGGNSCDNSKMKSAATKKATSKFVKANIQFFHSGHGAPPALADREKKKEKANVGTLSVSTTCSKLAASVAKSPATPGAIDSIKSEGQPPVNLQTTPVKPKRIIRLARKRPLHFQHETRPEKRFYDFLKMNDSTVDNRVPPECCRRGCKFLVNDVKKFLSTDVLSALKDFLSGNNFDCSCPCHFLSTSLINDINCQGAWMDAESNPRIRALLDLQRLVASVPRNYQNEFLQSTFYSPNESSTMNKSFTPQPNESSQSVDISVDLRCDFSASRNVTPVDFNGYSVPGKVKVDLGISDQSQDGCSSVGSKFRTRSSKVNPAVNALYSKYSSEIVSMDGTKIVMRFKRVKQSTDKVKPEAPLLSSAQLTKSLTDESLAQIIPDYPKFKMKGAAVEVFWDEKQLRGTDFAPGWYQAVVCDYSEDTDQLVVQDVLDSMANVYKLPFSQLLIEKKLRLRCFKPDQNNSELLSFSLNGIKSEPQCSFDEMHNFNVAIADSSRQAFSLQTSCSQPMSNHSSQISPGVFVNPHYDGMSTGLDPLDLNAQSMLQPPPDMTSHSTNAFDSNSIQNHTLSQPRPSLQQTLPSNLFHPSSCSLPTSSLEPSSAVSANGLLMSNNLLTDQPMHSTTTPSVCSDYFSESGIEDTPMIKTANNVIMYRSSPQQPDALSNSTFASSCAAVHSASPAHSGVQQVQYHLARGSSTGLGKSPKVIGFDDLSSDDESEKDAESGVENEDEFIKKNALNILDNLKMC